MAKRVTNNTELLDAYLLCDMLSRAMERGDQRAPEILRKLKTEIRKYTHREDERTFLVKDYVDGCVLRVVCPECIKSDDEAEEWFYSTQYIEAPNCAYDCTGRIFTRWHKFVKRGNTYHLYHMIVRDC